MEPKAPLADENQHAVIDVFSTNDGKLSIEQQIEVYVNDMFNIQDNKSVTLNDILEGLRYLMDFRIKGGYQPRLDKQLMKRLSEGLFLNMGHTEGSFLKKKTTDAADTAFYLFGDFLEEVEEFRSIISEMDISDLRQQLKIHYRCQPSSTMKQKRGALAIVMQLARFFPSQFGDWRDLIKESEQDDLERLLNSPLAEEIKLGDQNSSSKMPTAPQLVNALVLPPPQALHFDRSVEKLLAMFHQTDKDNGLPNALIPALREHYGWNQLPKPPKQNALKMIWQQLTDFIVLILIAAAVVEAAEKEFDSMIVLLIVVVLNTVIGFTQEWKASKTLNALMNLSVPNAAVIRDGQQKLIESAELVPGDLIVLEEGDAVPADVRLIDVSQLGVIESVLTGESLPVHKTTKAIKAKTRRIPLADCKGNAFMSTTVARGRGRGIVVRTGSKTEIGKISAAIQSGSQHKGKTPIQKKLQKLGIYLVAIAIFLCILVVVIGIIWKHDARTMVNIGLSLAVSVIPEGLVAVTTVTMAIGVRRMTANKCIVRTLPAVESLGSVTVICSDKTGTLTEGKMGTSELWTTDNCLYKFTEPSSVDPNDGQIILEHSDLRRRMVHNRRTTTTISTDKDNCSTGKDRYKPIDYAALKLKTVDTTCPDSYSSQFYYAMMISSLCNNSSIHQDENTGEIKTIGDPTEIALLVSSQKAGLGRSHWIRNRNSRKIFEHAFDSERKLMSSVYRMTDTSVQAALNTINTTSTSAMPDMDSNCSQVVMVCKGAPEELLRRCTHFMTNPLSSSSATQQIHADEKSLLVPDCYAKLTDDFVAQVYDENTRMASQGLRVLGLAYKLIPPGAFDNLANEGTHGSIDNSNNSDKNEVLDENDLSKDQFFAESNLIFVGLIGLIDPPKKGVKEAVDICQMAGIQVIMITGDHIETATAIATQLGIFQRSDSKKNRAILGRELDLLSDDAIMELNPCPTVFARVSPENKLSIVKALQSRGELVAMTGDGVNDAPAIKQANVGVAMGKAGTEITKQAADIVLVDDNFTSIVKAVEEGRHVFDNILKFIVYLLSCNGAEIFLMLICTIANIEAPLSVMMILWANIIADIPPAMALGVESKEMDLMKRKPRDPQMNVITKITWLVIFINSMLIAALSIAAYTISLYVLKVDLQSARSMVSLFFFSNLREKKLIAVRTILFDSTMKRHLRHLRLCN
ncbi:hypothetical protein BDF20DRAFT_888480 [Mycotypha africana]|uniref:uncharacterized protein n=1 Tax=Mycotypha africana TaxID=64632 RepID=UPI002301EB59|nr:uncharacterized protein BDF20DRAFT_888480 [Mycotypha africana]KAI8969932.1 hypothetical protein BDF20DRAFT_888480 [Mycotypha africana]